jgi:pimeloyl-ACP methyl ester carboxylesterase
MKGVQKFTIRIPSEAVDDLRIRIKDTQWPQGANANDWSTGTNPIYLKELSAYWLDEFDWKKQETALNKLPHFHTLIGDTDLHFIHIKGSGKDNIPLLLSHGFPDSFIRFLKVIPLLTKVEDGLSFDLVIPSLPGFGFSRVPSMNGMEPQRIAKIFDEVMKKLGYDKYFAHGGDWGSSISDNLAAHHSSSLRGIHITDTPYKRIFALKPEELSEEEKKFMQRGQQWVMTQGAYSLLQSSKPLTLSYGLSDSPIGLAAWILDMFMAWSDCNGQLENSFTRDELLTNISLYWFTQTIYSATRLYYESEKSAPSSLEKMSVPTGSAVFPKDIIATPKQFAERFYNIRQWTIMPRGGHFAAMEQPELLVNDIRSFVKKVIEG